MVAGLIPVLINPARGQMPCIAPGIGKTDGTLAPDDYMIARNTCLCSPLRTYG